MRRQTNLALGGLPNKLGERRMPAPGGFRGVFKELGGPSNLDGDAVGHGENLATAQLHRQYVGGTSGLNSRQVATDLTLGELIAARRKQSGLTQTDLARLIPGMTRSTLNSVENGATKTISGDVAEALCRHIPVTMRELVNAMGFRLEGPVTSLPDGMLEELEASPPEVLAAIQLLLA